MTKAREFELTFCDYDRGLPDPVYPVGNFTYPALGALGEGAELLDKSLALQAHLGRMGEAAKKLWRDHRCVSEVQIEALQDGRYLAEAMLLRKGLLKEAGDVLWYLNAIAKEVGASLEEVAQASLDKSLGRRARGTTCGSGDDR